MINRISNTNQINSLQNTRKLTASKPVTSFEDEIEVSQDAEKMRDAYFLAKVADETADVRTDLVEQIKLKIQDPNYLSAERISATADQILSAYGF